MDKPATSPIALDKHKLTRVPSAHSTTSSSLITSAWTAREYNGKHASQKRRACNECRQQKLRCDLANDQPSQEQQPQQPPITSCSRCVKLRLACKVDETFQRTRKRKRSTDFQEEIADLKKQLHWFQRQHGVPQMSPGNGNGPGDETPDRSAPGRISASPVAMKIAGGGGGIGSGVAGGALETKRTPSLVNNGLLPPPERSSTSPAGQPNGAAGGGGQVLLSEAEAIVTRPHEHELEAPSSAATALASRPRSVGNGAVTLREGEIERLYDAYFALYHDTMPIIDPNISAQQYCEMSPLLFWCIMAVASRRSVEHPTLLYSLAQPVMDLLWKAIRSVPHSPVLVQSILLICTWPFPTSSSATDPSYVLVHTAVSAAVQMGLHRPQHQQDFGKYRLKLTDKDIAARINLWTACNIVAQGTSLGVGLQSPAYLQDWSSLTQSSSKLYADLPKNIRQVLQTELFRDKVISALANDSFLNGATITKPTHERLPLYKLLERDWNLLNAGLDTSSALIRYHTISARLHLQAFFLFDDPASEEYDQRILSLIATASWLIQHLLDTETQTPPGFMPYCSFHAYQSLPLAGFVLLKVVRSEYFADLISHELLTARFLLENCIRLMRVMSVSDNDLALRLSDVLAYLYKHPNPRVVCGEGRGALMLEIQSRLSMSIVFDSLWRWRDQFRERQRAGVAAARKEVDAAVTVGGGGGIIGGEGQEMLGGGNGVDAADLNFHEAMQDLPALFQFDDNEGFPGSEDLYFDWFR